MANANLVLSANLFKNNHPDYKADTKFRKYADDKSFIEVVADYRISSTDGASGSCLKAVSKEGNPVLRVALSKMIGETRKWFYGTLVISKLKQDKIAEANSSGDPAALKKAMMMPDYFGTATVKNDEVEYELSAWKVLAKKGGEVLPVDKQYINLHISTPYNLEGAPDSVPGHFDDVPVDYSF